MGSKWGGRMWGHMKKAAASTASGLKSVGGEDAQKALAILAGTDADPVPPVVGSLARGAGDGRAGGDDISVEMRAMMLLQPRPRFVPRPLLPRDIAKLLYALIAMIRTDINAD